MHSARTTTRTCGDRLATGGRGPTSSLVSTFFLETWGPGLPGLQPHGTVGTSLESHRSISLTRPDHAALFSLAFHAQTTGVFAVGPCCFGVFFCYLSLPTLNRFRQFLRMVIRPSAPFSSTASGPDVASLAMTTASSFATTIRPSVAHSHSLAHVHGIQIWPSCSLSTFNTLAYCLQVVMRRAVLCRSMYGCVNECPYERCFDMRERRAVFAGKTKIYFPFCMSRRKSYK